MTSTLQHELGKLHPFEHPEEEAYLNLLRTMSLLENQTQRLFRSHGLSESTYNILRILRGHRRRAEASDQRFQGVPCSVVAGQLVAQVPDLTRLVDRLARAGFVKRRRSDTDRRVVLIDITESGLATLDVLEEPLSALHRSQLGHLTGGELTELNRLLVKAREPQVPSEVADHRSGPTESPPRIPANDRAKAS